MLSFFCMEQVQSSQDLLGVMIYFCAGKYLIEEFERLKGPAAKSVAGQRTGEVLL